MSYQTLKSPETKEQLAAHEKKWGRFNDVPPGFKEITAEEFAQSGFFTWCKEGVEFRQIRTDKIPKKNTLSPLHDLFPITMFYMNHGDNYAMGHDYWGKKVRYFKFADCYHEYRDMTAKELQDKNIRLFSCDHAQVCKKCGHVWVYNSGD